MAVVAVAIALLAAGLGAYLALRAADGVAIEDDLPARCTSPERLRGGESMDALVARVAADLLGDPDADVEVEGSVRPPCISSLASPGLELTADSFTSDVDGVLEVRLHDAELRYAETMRAGVVVTAGEPVELDLPPGAWAQAILHRADGTRLHALVPT